MLQTHQFFIHFTSIDEKAPELCSKVLPVNLKSSRLILIVATTMTIIDKRMLLESRSINKMTFKPKRLPCFTFQC